MTERDSWLERIVRTAVWCCLVLAAAAFVVTGGRWDAGAGVLGGGVLVGVSYWAIRAAVDALIGSVATAGEPSDRRRQARRLAWPLVKFIGHYALLGFLAYVMIARLRLHPIGLLTGASSIVAAATLEAIRAARH